MSETRYVTRYAETGQMGQSGDQRTTAGRVETCYVTVTGRRSGRFVTTRNMLRSCSDEGSRDRNFVLRTGLRNTPPTGVVCYGTARCGLPAADATFAWLDLLDVLGSVLGRCRANGCRRSGWQRHRSTEVALPRAGIPIPARLPSQSALSARTDHRPYSPFTRPRPGVTMPPLGVMPMQRDGVMGHG